MGRVDFPTESPAGVMRASGPSEVRPVLAPSLPGSHPDGRRYKTPFRTGIQVAFQPEGLVTASSKAHEQAPGRFARRLRCQILRFWNLESENLAHWGRRNRQRDVR